MRCLEAVPLPGMHAIAADTIEPMETALRSARRSPRRRRILSSAIEPSRAARECGVSACFRLHLEMRRDLSPDPLIRRIAAHRAVTNFVFSLN